MTAGRPITLSSSAGVVTCHVASGGYVENPVGGGTGVDATEAFTTWGCVQSAGECKTIAGVRETRVTATGLPWRSSLSKEEAGVVRDASGFEVKLECYDHGQLEGSLELDTARARPCQRVKAHVYGIRRFRFSGHENAALKAAAPLPPY